MSARAWVAMCLLSLGLGGICGWSARVHTTNDSYINALAGRMVAERTYFEERTDQLIRMNAPKQYAVEREVKRGTKKD